MIWVLLSFSSGHGKHFAEAEQAHGDNRDAEAVPQFRHPEDEPLLAGYQVDADRAEKQSEADHREHSYARALADAENERKAEHEQRCLLDRAEGERRGRDLRPHQRDP